MALKVWLPLNGDLHNQGCSDVIATGNNLTSNATGKIGSCYNFNGSSSYINLNAALLNSSTKEFSYCCWVKFNVLNKNQCLFSNRTKIGQTGFSIIYITPNKFYFDAGSRLIITVPITLVTGQWYHFAFTFKNSDSTIDKRAYINGEEMINAGGQAPDALANATQSFIGASQNSSITVSDNYLNGSLNDVRIYNHCLSAAEVREISQGLVLHYKLNDMTSTTVEDSSGYGHSGIRAGTISAYTDSPRYSQCMNLSATSSRINCGRGGMMKDSITINFWANLPTIPSEISDRTAIVSCSESGGFRVQIGNDSHLHSIIYINSAYAVIDGETVLQPNTWYMMTLVYDRINGKLYEYLNGKKEAEVDVGSTSNIGYHSNNVVWIGVEARSATSYYSALAEKVSDFRIYCTPLNADAIRQLYEVSAKIDNKQNLHTFELAELNSGKELINTYLTPSYTNHTTMWNDYDENGEITLIGNSQLGSPYIKVNPVNKKYIFDADISIDANNQVFIGFQRYDAAKTTRQNDATLYAVNIKPSSTQKHKHYHFVYNTNFNSFDANTPIDTISLRVLNDWNNAANREMTIHKMSFREVPIIEPSKINKKGQVITDELMEMNKYTRIQKDGIVETKQLIEL